MLNPVNIQTIIKLSEESAMLPLSRVRPKLYMKSERNVNKSIRYTHVDVCWLSSPMRVDL
jgi:hypothetical protein